MTKELFVKFALGLCVLIGLILVTFDLGLYKGTVDEYESWQVYLEDKIVINKFSMPIKEKDIIRISSNQGLREMLSGSEAGGVTSGMWHNGIDIACLVGTDVHAAKGGTVISVYPSKGNGPGWKGHRSYGGLVIIEHPDCTVTLYAHLYKTLVKEGEVVSEDDIIALSGGKKGERGSGISTGPHLHFAIYPNIAELISDYELDVKISN